MNPHQKKVLAALFDGPPVQLVDEADAKTLIEAGHARRVALSPEPKDKTAINITALGRGAVLRDRGQIVEHVPVDNTVTNDSKAGPGGPTPPPPPPPPKG